MAVRRSGKELKAASALSWRSGQVSHTNAVTLAENRTGLVRFTRMVSQRPPGTASQEIQAGVAPHSNMVVVVALGHGAADQPEQDLGQRVGDTLHVARRTGET